MANRTLNFEAGNGDWWGPCSHETNLLIGPGLTFIEYTWRISCSFVGKYDWKTVESYAIWFGLFDNIIWRELLVSLYLPPNFCGTAFPGQESPLDIAIFLWSGNNLGFKILENPNDYFSRKLPWYSSGAAIQIQLFSSSTLFTFFNLYVLLEKIRSGPYTSFYCFCFVF